MLRRMLPTATQPPSYLWFPGLITGKTGSGTSARYEWVHRWVEGSGDVGNMPGVASGTTTSLAGVCVTGEDLEVGQHVLARPGPGAGGMLYELVPVSVTTSPPPPPPPPPPGGAGSGWGWVSGLDKANHCFEVSITTGNASGRSSCIGNATLRLAYNATNGVWQTGTGSNMTYCCGNAPMQLQITSGQPFLKLLGNGTACNNQTLGNYNFSFDGSSFSTTLSDQVSDVLYFRGGGNVITNGTFMTSIPSANPQKPTAYLNSFALTVRLMRCPSQTCCSNVTLSDTLHATVHDTGSPNFSGNYTISFYRDAAFSDQWNTVIDTGGNEYLLQWFCNSLAWWFSIRGPFAVGDLAPQIEAGNLTNYLVAVGGATIRTANHTGETAVCYPYSVATHFDAGGVLAGNVTVTE